MDSTLQDVEIDRLNEKDKVELRQFLTNEAQKARIQATVHSLTDMCFKKCVTGTIKNHKLDKGEESCMVNCADRFLDVSSLTMKHLQNLRQG